MAITPEVDKAPRSGNIVRVDPRAMNHMDPETRLVHAMLEQWGRETRDGAQGSLPARTVLGRVIDQGPGAGEVGGPVSLSVQSARVDECVARLWKQTRRCVERYYQSWEPSEVMARKEGISTTQFREHLRRARHLIGMWLDLAKYL